MSTPTHPHPGGSQTDSPPSSDYIAAASILQIDGYNYNYSDLDQSNVKRGRGRRCFLSLAIISILIMIALICSRANPINRPMQAERIDAPDYVYNICYYGVDGNGNDYEGGGAEKNIDADVLCYQSDSYYECSCECYEFSWFEDEDPKISNSFCKDDDEAAGSDDYVAR